MCDDVQSIPEYFFFELASTPVVIEVIVAIARDLELRGHNKKDKLLVQIHWWGVQWDHKRSVAGIPMIGVKAKDLR